MHNACACLVFHIYQSEKKQVKCTECINDTYEEDVCVNMSMICEYWQKCIISLHIKPLHKLYLKLHVYNVQITFKCYKTEQ